MLRSMKIILVILFVVGTVYPVGAAPIVFADKAQDTQTMNSLMAQTESGVITLEQALVAAIEKGISFNVIIDACNSRGIALSNIITAAATIGISSTAIMAWMADAEVPAAQINTAYAAATGQPDTGLGYTPAQSDTKPVTVPPVTTTPTGTTPKPSVSPSTL